MTLSLYYRGYWRGERFEKIKSQPPQITHYNTIEYDRNHVKTTVSRRRNFQFKYIKSLTPLGTPTVLGGIGR